MEQNLLKEQASEQSHRTIAATSSAVPSRFIGLLSIMVWTKSGAIWSRIAVSTAAGATQFTRISVRASSLASDLVKAITPALAAE
jgi:hypothetical protein